MFRWFRRQREWLVAQIEFQVQLQVKLLVAHHTAHLNRRVQEMLDEGIRAIDFKPRLVAAARATLEDALHRVHIDATPGEDFLLREFRAAVADLVKQKALLDEAVFAVFPDRH